MTFEWIELPLVLAVHEAQIATHGGASGIRDEGLLESALARPRQIESYGEADIYSLATAYTSGIIKNHPFVDGNKRTGFVTGVIFLETNGPDFTASEAVATQAVLSLAAGQITEADFAAWLKTNSEN